MRIEVARRGLARALYLAALLLPSWATAGDASVDSTRLTAILIVARGGLPDPLFGDSMVLVMNNLAPGPIGVIVNRPTNIRVANLFPDMKRLAKFADKVYFGGPVGLGSVWFIFRAARPQERAVQAFEGVYLSTDRRVLSELLARHNPMEGLRIYIGHSSWAPGQLESEISDGDWIAQAADSDSIFNNKSEHPISGSDAAPDSGT